MSANEFEKGDLVTISSGCHAGKKGTIVRDVYPNGTLAVKIDGVKNSLGYMPGELEAAPWRPKPGDRVRVEAGSNYLGLSGTVVRTDSGLTGEITVVDLEAYGAQGCVLTANLEPAEKPHISDVVGVTIKTEPKPATWSIEEIRAAAAQSAKLTPLPHGYFADMTMGAPYEPFKMPITSKSTIRPRSISDQDIADMINYAGQGDERRADGHSTGPILTGDARTSYLALQSGAEDPHAKPEPLTEPSCAYCKDTGIGVMGMECPVRSCEAVST